MQKKMLQAILSAALAFCCMSAEAAAAETKSTTSPQIVATFTGTVPGNPQFGDSYGQIVQLYNYKGSNYVYAAAPLAQQFGDDSISAAAVYVYKSGANGNKPYIPLQILETNGLLDQLGTESSFPANDWLFLSANGTPLGDIQPDFTQEDFTGSVVIYRMNPSTGLYEFVAILDRNVPGLGDLSPLTQDNPLGAAFGNILSVDINGGWLFVGGISQSITQNNVTTFNCGKAYAFQLDPITQSWKLRQTFTNPVSGLVANDNFGTNVFVSGSFAVVTNGDDTVQPQAHITNSSAYVYQLVNGVWTFVQQLKGDQTQALSNSIGMFDGFGCSLWMDGKWMLVGAPFESTISKFNGAAYFFHYENGQWVKKTKVISPDTTSQQQCLTVFNSVQIKGDMAVVGAPGSAGPNGLYQGSVLVYQLNKQNNVWNFVNQLFDPNGKSYDSFWFRLFCSK